MTHLLRFAILATALTLPLSAEALPDGAPLTRRPGNAADYTGSIGRAPWQAPYEYDSGSDNDRRPELPYYQQGGGQQTGGPARNLLHYDGGSLTPR